MLNPGFKLLDPEKEQLERLRQLFNIENCLVEDMQIKNEWLKKYDDQIKKQIEKVGVIKQSTLWGILENLKAKEIKDKEISLMGIPVGVLNKVLTRISDPVVGVLGILTGDGLWVGCIIGASDKGIDFLTTFHWLWQEEPEMATKQKMEDFDDICQSLGKRFSRKTIGLFTYLNEFKQMVQSGFDQQVIRDFSERKIARYKWL